MGNGVVPILVGGNFNYLRALLFDYHTLKANRKVLKTKYAEKYNLDYLKAIDPDHAQQLHPNDTRKIIHACSYYDNYNEKLSSVHREQKKISKFKNACIIFLDPARNALDNKIRARFDAMHASDKCIKEFEEFYDLNRQWIFNDDG